MRPTPTLRPGRIPVLAALLLLGAGWGCDEPTRPDADVRFLEIILPDTILRPGFWMQAIAEPLDAQGRVLEGRTVNWRPLTPSTLAVGADGRLLALAPGIGRARASIGAVSSEVRLTLRNPPAASVTITIDTLRLTLPVASAALAAVVRDSDGVEIFRPDLRWETGASRIAAVASTGVVSAVAAGRTEVIALADGRADTTVVLVEAPASPTAPQVATVQPAVAAPGQALTLTGAGFAPLPGANAVLVDGVAVTVTSAAENRLTLLLPPAAAFPCRATGPAAVQVTTAGGIGVGWVELQVAPQRALAPGQSLVLATPAEARCVELVPSAGRYLVTVQNATRAVGSQTIALTLGGAQGAIAGGAALAAPAGLAAWRAPVAARAGGGVARTSGAAPVRGPLGFAARGARERRFEAALLHEQLRTLPLAARARAAAGVSTTPATAPVAARSAPLTASAVGDVVPLRVANLDAADFCGVFTPIGARTVFVGPHVVILEDTTPTLNGVPTLRGLIDAEYAALGAEFESRIWPVISRFGDPLAMDSRLDANGQVAIVVTPRMNVMRGGAALAATVECDFYSRAQQPSSNVGEYVYVQVPTALEPAGAPGSVARWRAELRGTVAHEMKHIVSNAERFSRGLQPEHLWLEEATARVAEELFAREVYGTQQGGEHGFDVTLRCEVFLGAPGSPCADSPRAMLPHLEGLYEYLARPTERSPLGATAAGDVSWYGSGWAFVRWMLDQGPLTEATALTTLTQSSQRGLENLEARAGRNWEQALGAWSLAVALDGRTGFTPADPTGRFPSWDLTSLFGGLCATIGACADPERTGPFARAHPLAPLPLTAGGLAAEIPSLVPGGFQAFELSGGSTATRQLLELRGYRGATLPPAARLAITRIE